jgi:hypothetical protein
MKAKSASSTTAPARAVRDAMMADAVLAEIRTAALAANAQVKIADAVPDREETADATKAVIVAVARNAPSPPFRCRN